MEHVAQSYSSVKPVRCRLYNQTINDMYLIETPSDSFIYRIWAQTDIVADSLEAILEMQFRCKEHGLPVVHPMSLLSGQYLQTLYAPEGERFAALFSFASGKPAGRGITPEQSTIVGELTGNFHLIADTFKPCSRLLTHDLNFLLLEPFNIIQSCVATSVEQRKTFESILRVLSRHIDSLEKTTPLFGICHGDIHGMNILFDEDKVALLDFDWLSYGWRAWDLAVFIWWIRGVKDELQVEQTFLDGYRSTHPQAQNTIEAIPVFVPVRHLLLTSRIINYANSGIDVGRWIDEAFIDKRLNFIQTWMRENRLLD